MTHSREGKLIVALDCHVPMAKEIVRRLEELNVKYKVSSRMLLEPDGHAFVWQLLLADHAVMLDLKLFDHPDTVRETARMAREMGFWALTVHAHDQRVLEAALKGRDQGPMRLLGVTVLSSQTPEDLNEQACYENEQDADLCETIRYRTIKTIEAGFDGVVCPAANVDAAKDVVKPGIEFMIVTPGVRDIYVKGHDQHRETATASYATAKGATHVVVGRPIINAMYPMTRALQFITDMVGD